MTNPDPIAALVALTAANSDVSDLVGAKVFGGELPEDETDNMPQKCVVITPAGGLQVIGTSYLDTGDLRVDTLCYGGTPYEAGLVWWVVHRVLKKISHEIAASTLIHWARPAGGPRRLRDPDADWPFQLATFQVLAFEREVSA